MKKTDKQTLQTKGSKELQTLIAEAKKTLDQLKLDHVQNKLKNTRSIFNMRKEIAVLQSVLHIQVKVEAASASEAQEKEGKK
jgi:ribosomal protein L29